MRFVLDVSPDGVVVGLVRWLAEVASKFAGRKIIVTVEPWVMTRSAKQNRYYWAIVEIIGNFFGSHKDEMHEELAFMFLKVVNVRTGRTSVRSTAKLNTGEFETYLVRCRQWAADEYGISVPLPNEYEQSDYLSAKEAA